MLQKEILEKLELKDEDQVLNFEGDIYKYRDCFYIMDIKPNKTLANPNCTVILCETNNKSVWRQISNELILNEDKVFLDQFIFDSLKSMCK